MIQMAFRGLLGRKRDSAILGGILLLAFLFLTLSSILLASFSETAKRDRQALHGKWQLLYYGADAEAERLCAAQAACGAIRMVGTTQSNQLIGTVNDSVMELGSLRLTEGRLPQGEDEIVLVRGRMQDEPALGEDFSTVYLYTYMQGSSSGWLNDQESFKQAVVQSLRSGETDPSGEELSWQSIEEEFLQYVKAHYLPEQNVISFDPEDENSDWFMSIPEDYDLDRMLEENEDTLLYWWAVVIHHPFSFYDSEDAYAYRSIRSYPGGLYGFENFTINVKSEEIRTTYSGWAFDESFRESSSSEMQTAQTLIYKTYTVVGYMEPYADHWDVRGLSMPDAFVSDAAADAQLRAIRRAEEDYYEGAPTYAPTEILLLYGDEADRQETAQQILSIFSAQQKPYFRTEGISVDMMDNENALLIGLDPETGKEKICQLEKYGNSYYMYDPLTEATCTISGDPTASMRWEEFSDILLPLNPEALTQEELERDNTHPLRLNQFSYPPNGTEQSLQTLCSSVLIGVAACSVFQVFWVQLRRRQRRLTTLMAVGATDGQLLSMLLSEIILLLVLNGILGTGLGFLLARLISSRLDTIFTVEWRRLLLGILLCVAAVSVSALIPMLLVLRAPLTGHTQLSRHTIKLAAPRKMRRQSWARLILRQLRVNRGRTILQLSMAFLLATICLLTLFLCHYAYAGYRKSVEDTAMPDYELVVPYGMSLRFLRSTLEEQSALRQQMDVSVTREAPNVRLAVDEKLRQSPIVQALSASTETSIDKDTLAVRVIGLEADALDAFLAQYPNLSVNREAILQRESCLLLVPRYAAQNGKVLPREANATELEELRTDERAGYLLSLFLSPRYESVTQEDRTLSPGDSLHLSAKSTAYNEDRFFYSENTLDMTVAAVLSSLNAPRWPLSEQSPAYVIITGVPPISALYPSANTHMSAAQTRYHAKLSQIFYPDSYGLTRILLTNQTQDDPIAADTMAYNLAETLGVDLINYRLVKERSASEAENRCLLFLLLGIEMVLVLSTLLYAAAMMAAEQDRDRYGLLQALGLSDGRVFFGQLLQGFCISAVGCLGANLVLGAVLLLVALFSGTPKLTLLDSLNAYPWRIHVIACLSCLFAYALLQAFPIRRLSKVQPIENIRS